MCIRDRYTLTITHTITGHSMGGHGALTIALKNPSLFKSVSAFAPICNPKQCPWGQNVMHSYITLFYHNTLYLRFHVSSYKPPSHVPIISRTHPVAIVSKGFG